MSTYFYDPSWRRRQQLRILWGWVTAIILVTLALMGGVCLLIVGNTP